MFVPEELRAKSGPARSPAPVPPPAPAASARRFEGEPAILVVDDLDVARKLAKVTLEKMGMPVLEAESGYEALHILLHHPEVALVILDVVMPGQLGTQTLQEIRRQHAGVRVIVVTGYGLENAEEMLNGVEPDAVIAKPYSPSVLVEAAKTALAA